MTIKLLAHPARSGEIFWYVPNSLIVSITSLGFGLGTETGVEGRREIRKIGRLGKNNYGLGGGKSLRFSCEVPCGGRRVFCIPLRRGRLRAGLVRRRAIFWRCISFHFSQWSSIDGRRNIWRRNCHKWREGFASVLVYTRDTWKRGVTTPNWTSRSKQMFRP